MMVIQKEICHAVAEVSTVSLRDELVRLAVQADANVAQVCRRFGISRKTGYKWLKRYAQDGVIGLADRSRRPRQSPKRTSLKTEAAVLGLRVQHPWGGHKLRRRLVVLGHAPVPAASTISTILKRHGLIDPVQSLKAGCFNALNMRERMRCGRWISKVIS